MSDPDLRQLAEAATPGPWGAKFEQDTWYGPTDESGDFTKWEIAEADPSNVDYPWCEPHLEGAYEGHRTADIAYIAAANPAVVLDLLDRLAASVPLADVLAAIEGLEEKLYAVIDRSDSAYNERREFIVAAEEDGITNALNAARDAIKTLAEEITDE